MIFNFNTSLVTVYLCFVQATLYTCHYFNTSHVTVYPVYIFHGQQSFNDFNTSHVTVYHIRSRCDTVAYRISIHLMLLFILFCANHALYVSLFQYISCYCLSAVEIMLVICLVDFNTSHVTVYQRAHRSL